MPPPPETFEPESPNWRDGAPIGQRSGAVAHRRPGLAWAIILLLLSGAVVMSGLYRRQTGAQLGPAHVGPTAPTTQPTVYRFGTFNMASGVGTDGVRNLPRSAATLGSCQIVGLNETAADLSGNDQPTTIAALLNAKMAEAGFAEGAQWVGWFAPSEIRWWHPHFGNGLLTRVAIDQPLWLPMPSTQERGRRNLVWAVVPMGGARVNLLLTHIDRQADQAAQLKMVREMFERVAAPAVLMGDFNVGVSHPELVRLLSSPGVVHSGTGYAGAGDATRVEHIFVKGLDVVKAGIVELGASDHPMVWADLALPSDSPAARRGRP